MKSKQYLFVPIMPTPNGRLHIGHISGPYLKSDILARNLRLCGHDARIISGVDTYEAHVCLKAYQENSSPEVVNTKYHKLMLDDLEALNIHFDDFINPLQKEHNKNFTALHKTLYSKLLDNNKLEIKEESFFKKNDGTVVNGCWIRGSCADCGKSMKAFYCEDCGANLRPEEILNHYFIPELKEEEYVISIEEKCAYIKVDPAQLESKWQEMDLPDRFISIAKRHLEKEGNTVRMTAPDAWGINAESKDFTEHQVMFSYTTMYFYSLYCAELYSQKFQVKKKPFENNSDVITIAAFGIDNTNAYLIAFLGAAYALDLKPFDYFLTNCFFQLDNRKIASSSGHAIWAKDLVTEHGYPSDSVRLYLMSINPQYVEQNFTLKEFDLFNKSFYFNNLLHKIQVAKSKVDRDELDGVMEEVELGRDVISQQQSAFEFPQPDMKLAIQPIIQWLNIFENDNELESKYYVQWLLVLSTLTYSLAPLVSHDIQAFLRVSKDDLTALVIRL